MFQPAMLLYLTKTTILMIKLLKILDIYYVEGTILKFQNSLIFMYVGYINTIPTNLINTLGCLLQI